MCNGNAGIQQARTARITAIRPPTAQEYTCKLLVLLAPAQKTNFAGDAGDEDLGFRGAAPTNATPQPSDGITLFEGAVMVYRCVATSVAGFVQQLAVAYVTHGYYFYVTGMIPEHKDPLKTDEKILRQYGIEVSKWTRARRKMQRRANVQYLRYGRFYILIATHGEHPFFAAEAKRLKDIRRHPLRFEGYAVGCRRARGGGKYHPSVRISRDQFRKLKVYFRQVAVEKSVEELTLDLRSMPFEAYAPVRDQLMGILRAVNQRRKFAALELVPREALRLRRAAVQPFGRRDSSADDER